MFRVVRMACYGMVILVGLSGSHPGLAQDKAAQQSVVGEARDSVGESRLNMTGSYGRWLAEKVLGEGPGRLSFRTGKWESLDAWRRVARERVWECLSPVELGGLPEVRVESQSEYDGLKIERLSWQLPGGPRTEAIFMKPAGATGKLPGILALHDHGGNKFLGWRKIARIDADPPEIVTAHQSHYYGGVAWANAIAKRGYAVLIHDTFPFASRRVRVADVSERIRQDGVDPNAFALDEIKRYNAFAAAHEQIMEKSLISAGTTWPGVYVVEDQRALDVLCARADVDATRVGCAGLSGGGMRTVFLGGLDDRIRCAVAVGFMTTWRDFLLDKCFTHTWMTYVPLLPRDLDFPEILALRAPKATMVLNCTEDALYTLPEMRRADAMMRDTFARGGAAEMYRCLFYSGGHKFDLEMQQDAFTWFDQHLKDVPAALPLPPREKLGQEAKRLEASLGRIRPQTPEVDVAVFLKGVRWALDYDREFSQADEDMLRKAVERARQRIDAIASGKIPWSTRQGKMVLGYLSRIDGSIQPYGLVIPRQYDGTRPMRLDVVLHGSTRPVGMSELRFMFRFDEGDAAADASQGPDAQGPDVPFLELHPLGRVENCYRWAGETDVFEAIEDVCRRYRIDRDRIVLRGMSMGASGTWHLGLKHPDRFVALGPYCGYVDTHRFSETPLPNFVKVGPLPDHQERALHMLDSVDYAANAGIVPAIACMGENDVFFQAHVIMGEAMRREGLAMVNLISPGTGHVIDPKTHQEQMRRISEHVAQGVNRRPSDLRFVTWTLKYNRCHWLSLLGLKRHYERAEFVANVAADTLDVQQSANITAFAIELDQLPSRVTAIQIGGARLELTEASRSAKRAVVVERDGRWQLSRDEKPKVATAEGPGTEGRGRKRPGVQGPIDDAFVSPFVCVRGTGTPWNTAVHVYANACLQRFADEWRHYFRGDLAIKNDSEVTEDDVRHRNLILFGDPGSNRWIAKVLPALPIAWNRETLRTGEQEFSSASHIPALIAPNPLAVETDRYVVLNSGHTFHEAELNKLNYLLFPRWGDWAVIRVDANSAKTLADETPVAAGFCDERWRIPPR